MTDRDSLSARHLVFVDQLVLLRKTPYMLKKRYAEMHCYFWCINTLHVLDESRYVDRFFSRKELLSFIMMCHNTDGGFAASIGLESNISATLCALQILVLLGELQKSSKICHTVAHFIQSLYVREGFYLGHPGGEYDVQHTYCALYCMCITGSLHLVDKEAVSCFLCKCLNTDGGIGNSPQCESHSGQIFCCLASLTILGTLNTILTSSQKERLACWLANRQNVDGGLCGRPNKKSDSCYSWWVCASLSLLSKKHWIDSVSLLKFLEKCERLKGGGFAEKPCSRPDPYHTFFALAGISLMQRSQRNCESQIWGTLLVQLSCVFAISKNLQESFLL